MTKELEDKIEVLEKTVKRLLNEIKAKDKMTDDIKSVIGDSNFEEILSLQGYKLQK